MAHVLCCPWYTACSSYDKDTGWSWFDTAAGHSEDNLLLFRDAPRSYQYLASFHWAVGQLALGTVDIYPRSSLERVMFVMATVIGFLVGSTLISPLSASIIEYHMNK